MIDPAAHPLPLAEPREAARDGADVRDRARDAGPRGLRRGAAADRLRHAGRRSSRRGRTDGSCVGLLGAVAGHRVGDGPRDRASAAGFGREPARRRRGLRGRRSSSSIVRLHRASKLQRCRGTPAADRQGLGEHRRRAQAAPRPAAQPRRRRARADGLRAGRPDPGDRGCAPPTRRPPRSPTRP